MVLLDYSLGLIQSIMPRNKSNMPRDKTPTASRRFINKSYLNIIPSSLSKLLKTMLENHQYNRGSASLLKITPKLKKPKGEYYSSQVDAFILRLSRRRQDHFYSAFD